MAKNYTKINNELITGLAKSKFKRASTYMVLLAIIRNTLSYHRNQHEMSNGFLAKATGLSERSVIRAIQELEQLKIIKITSESCGSHPRTIRIYTDRVVTMTDVQGGTDSPVSENTDNPVSNNTDSPVTQEIKETKDIKEREKKEITFSSDDSDDCFASLEEANAYFEAHPELWEDEI